MIDASVVIDVRGIEEIPVLFSSHFQVDWPDPLRERFHELSRRMREARADGRVTLTERPDGEGDDAIVTALCLFYWHSLGMRDGQLTSYGAIVNKLLDRLDECGGLSPAMGLKLLRIGRPTEPIQSVVAEHPSLLYPGYRAGEWRWPPSGAVG